MNTNMQSRKVYKFILAALFVALSYIFLFVFHFNVSFLNFEAKDSIITLGALILGAPAAVLMSAAVTFLEFITISDTGVYGLIMNFLACFSFSFTASLIYRRIKTMGGAILALGCASVVMTAVMLAANLVVTPYYMGISAAEVVKYFPKLLIPFNITKNLFNSALVLLLYKPVTTGLKKAGFLKNDGDYKLDSKTVFITIAAILLIALSVTVFIYVLKGSFELF